MKKYLFALAAVWLSACQLDEIPKPSIDETKERTFLIYMAADNSLGINGRSFDYQNIQSLLDGVDEHHLRENNILIYHDPTAAHAGRPDARPRLLQVEIGADGEAITREVEVYDEENSASPTVMNRVITQITGTQAFRADHYTLLMWSHGTAWLPANPVYAPATRAIGQDWGPGQRDDYWMDINEFASAIPDGVFDCIVMDACYMAAVEFAWVLRGKTDHLIVSPIEIMGSGMPYRLMPDYLLGAEPDYEAFCDAYYDYYEDYGSAISLVRPNEMDALAAAVRTILADVPMETIRRIPDGNMQYFDRLVRELHPYHIFFDLGSFMEQIATVAQMEAFKTALEQAVPYKRASDGFLLGRPGEGGFSITEYSGLSVFVPRETSNLEQVEAYYQTLGWHQAVYP